MSKKSCKKECSTCAWWFSSQLSDGICQNGDSPKKREWTNNNDTCKAWEDKGCLK